MASTAPIAADPMQRAGELLREMTLEEKAMQLSCVVPLALRAGIRLARYPNSRRVNGRRSGTSGIAGAALP